MFFPLQFDIALRGEVSSVRKTKIRWNHVHNLLRISSLYDKNSAATLISHTGSSAQWIAKKIQWRLYQQGQQEMMRDRFATELLKCLNKIWTTYYIFLVNNSKPLLLVLYFVVNISTRYLYWYKLILIHFCCCSKLFKSNISSS